MQRIVTIAVLTFAPFVLCAALTISRSAAEPILGEESLSLPPAEKQKEESSDALSLFKARDFEGSLKLWKEAAEKNPEMPPAQAIMAQLFSQANMSKEAQSAIEQAMIDAPDDPEPYLLMALFALHDRDFAKAETTFQKAGTLLAAFQKSAKRKESLQFRLQGGLAALAETRHDWVGSQKSLEAMLKLDPKNIAAMQRSAYCLFQQKKPDAALERLRDAVKINPALLTPEATMAQFCQRAGDLPNATKWMAAALAAAPKKSLATRLAIGQCALELGLMDQAQQHAVAAMQINPEALEAEFFRGLVALCQKDYRTAESYFESALKRTPAASAFPITNNLALALIEQNDEAKRRLALEYTETNARQFPKSSAAQSTNGWVLYRMGRLDDAENALRAAAALGPMSIDTAYFTARVAVDRGRKAEAKRVLETALKNTERAMFRADAEELLEGLKK